MGKMIWDAKAEFVHSQKTLKDLQDLIYKSSKMWILVEDSRVDPGGWGRSWGLEEQA